MTTTPWPKAICFALIFPLILLNHSNHSLLPLCLRLHVSVYANHRMHKQSNEQAILLNTRHLYVLFS